MAKYFYLCLLHQQKIVVIECCVAMQHTDCLMSHSKHSNDFNVTKYATIGTALFNKEINLQTKTYT